MELLGGVPFDSDNCTSLWSLPEQFFCWWKNNIERKSKYQTITKDASFIGKAMKGKQRYFVHSLLFVTNTLSFALFVCLFILLDLNIAKASSH